MSTIKRLRAPLVMMFGVTVAAVAFAMPASAADGDYPAPAGTDVLGTNATTNTPVAGVATTNTPVAVAGVSASTTADEGLAFTGGAVAGVGALGGLLLVGGTAMVVASRRRKADA